MAVHHVCDGCGVSIADGVEQIGFVLRRDYCAECAVRVREYGGEIDALHNKLAARWKKDLAGIRARAAKHIKLLPDFVPVAPIAADD